MVSAVQCGIVYGVVLPLGPMTAKVFPYFRVQVMALMMVLSLSVTWRLLNRSHVECVSGCYLFQIVSCLLQNVLAEVMAHGFVFLLHAA